MPVVLPKRKGNKMPTHFNVEIFNNGKFVQWFPATSVKEIFSIIAKYEGVSKLKDLKLSYLIFQADNRGRWYFGNTHYNKVCTINAKGTEKPEFFVPSEHH